MTPTRHTIEPLQAAHITALVSAYAVAPPGYAKYFAPFPFETDSLHRILAERREDLYFVVLWDRAPVGIYMLRGFDQGYTIPSYGVWIAPDFSRRGLGWATLEHAVLICRTRGCKQLMLKVHPLNTLAKRLYEHFGFVQTAVDQHNDNLVYTLVL